MYISPEVFKNIFPQKMYKVKIVFQDRTLPNRRCSFPLSRKNGHKHSLLHFIPNAFRRWRSDHILNEVQFGQSRPGLYEWGMDGHYSFVLGSSYPTLLIWSYFHHWYRNIYSSTLHIHKDIAYTLAKIQVIKSKIFTSHIISNMSYSLTYGLETRELIFA